VSVGRLLNQKSANTVRCFPNDATATFSGEIYNNEFSLSNNDVSSVGMAISISTGEIVTFEEAVTGNTMTIDGETTGDYGFDLDTTLGVGTIDFNGNSSQAELSVI